LTLIATFGLSDRIREDARNVVEDLKDAGVTTRMITGDHKETALFVAREIGVVKIESEQGVISGHEFRETIAPYLTRSSSIGFEF